MKASFYAQGGIESGLQAAADFEIDNLAAFLSDFLRGNPPLVLAVFLSRPGESFVVDPRAPRTEADRLVVQYWPDLGKGADYWLTFQDQKTWFPHSRWKIKNVLNRFKVYSATDSPDASLSIRSGLDRDTFKDLGEILLEYARGNLRFGNFTFVAVDDVGEFGHPFRQWEADPLNVGEPWTSRGVFGSAVIEDGPTWEIESAIGGPLRYGAYQIPGTFSAWAFAPPVVLNGQLNQSWGIAVDPDEIDEDSVTMVQQGGEGDTFESALGGSPYETGEGDCFLIFQSRREIVACTHRNVDDAHPGNWNNIGPESGMRHLRIEIPQGEAPIFQG